MKSLVSSCLTVEFLARVAATLVVACSALAGSTGCASLVGGAKQRFSQQHSCPESRVVASPRQDLDAYAMTLPAVAPPADVAADSERLAMWSQQQNQMHDSYDANFAVVEVSGCDHREFYACAHPDGAEGGTDIVHVMCMPAMRPPGGR